MSFEKVVEIAKKRGFFYPSSEIHGAIAGFWNYGVVGTLLKKKIENEWRNFFIKKEGFYEIEGTNIMPEKVFIASGHLKSFSDPIVQCKKCKSLYRADKLIEEKTGIFVPERASIEEFNKIIKEKNIKCPKCNGELSEVKFFNMMIKVNIGPTEESDIAYLRPETCQAIFVDFLNVYRSARAKLPFGIAQIGRSFRNEISPRQTLMRQREFTQAEVEIFFNPKNENFPDEKFNKIKDYKVNVLSNEKLSKLSGEEIFKITKSKLIAYYLVRLFQFINTLGIPVENIRLREQTQDERPFYAKYAYDCEVKTQIGWIEIVANHYRSDYDLSSHMKISKKDLSIVENKEKLIPHVWEISQGIDRTLLCVMLLHYHDASQRGWEWFSFPPRIAPYTVGVFPLVSKDNLPQKAKEVFEILKDHFDAFYDESGSIGKRYARADEIGTPFGITIDYQTLEDNTVTLRNRDTTKQVRIKIEKLPEVIKKLLNEEIKFEDL
ncbi:MAG: glycine--tRNA ligase [Candidatus Micrarchaeia archaeon]